MKTKISQLSITLLAATLFTGAAACSGGSITNDAGLPQNDSNLPTNDNVVSPDRRTDRGGNEPDSNIPQGNGAAYLTVAVTPPRAFYRVDQEVTLKATVKDPDGNNVD